MAAARQEAREEGLAAGKDQGHRERPRGRTGRREARQGRRDGLEEGLAAGQEQGHRGGSPRDGSWVLKRDASRASSTDGTRPSRKAGRRSKPPSRRRAPNGRSTPARPSGWPTSVRAIGGARSLDRDSRDAGHLRRPGIGARQRLGHSRRTAASLALDRHRRRRAVADARRRRARSREAARTERGRGPRRHARRADCDGRRGRGGAVRDECRRECATRSRSWRATRRDVSRR